MYQKIILATLIAIITASPVTQEKKFDVNKYSTFRFDAANTVQRGSSNISLAGKGDGAKGARGGDLNGNVTVRSNPNGPTGLIQIVTGNGGNSRAGKSEHGQNGKPGLAGHGGDFNGTIVSNGKQLNLGLGKGGSAFRV